MIHLTLTVRRILFYFFIAVFLFSSPFVVVYALGYSFNIHTRVFEQRGGIFVKSKTGGLTIALDDLTVKETSLFSGNALITDVEPGMHRVRIAKEGYHSWGKKILVIPGVVTEFRNVMLVPRGVHITTAAPEDQARIARRKESQKNAPLHLNAKNELLYAVGTTTEIIARNVHSFAVMNEGLILFVDRNGFLARLALASRALEILGRPGFYLEKEPVRFIASSEERTAAIIDSLGGLYLLEEAEQPRLEPLTGGVKNALFDEQEEKLLLIREQELEVAVLKKSPEGLSEREGIGGTIIESPKKIIDAAWFYDTDRHVVFVTGDGVFFTDIDRRAEPYTVQIAAQKFQKVFTFPETPRMIFLEDERGVYTLEL